MQFFQERCCVVMTGCQDNKSCSKVLNFLERLDDRIRCTHKETVAVVKPWKDVGSNKSFGCVFSEKPAYWTNAFKLEISSLVDFYDVLLHGQFWVKNALQFHLNCDTVKPHWNKAAGIFKIYFFLKGNWRCRLAWQCSKVSEHSG